MKFKRLADQELRGKRVFIRADLNVPQDAAGNITDDTRIRASVPGIRLALDRGAAVMVTSHLGRPKEGSFDAKDSLAPVAKRLSELLGFDGSAPARLVGRRRGGSRQSRPARELPLQRRREGGRRSAVAGKSPRSATSTSTTRSAPRTGRRRRRTALRDSPSIACAGPLMAAELDALSRALADPKRPLVAIVAGSKVSTKLHAPARAGEKGGPADRRRRHPQYLPAGAGTADRQIARRGGPGRGGEENHGRRREVPLPEDVVVAGEMSARARETVTDARSVAADDMILDIGPKSAAGLAGLLKQAGTIVWNGPVGVFEIRRSSPRAPKRSRAPSRRRRRSRSPAAATPSPRSTSSASPTASTTSPPPAARSSNSSRARRCPRWRCSRNGLRLGACSAAPKSSPPSGRPQRPGRARAHGARRRRRGAAELLARHGRRPLDARRAGEGDRPQDRAHGRHHVRPAGPEDPRRQVQGRQGRCCEKGQAFVLDAGCELGDGDRAGLDYKELPRDVERGRGAAAGRRQDRARRHRGARRGGAHQGAPRRRAVQQQGHQPPGRRADRAGAHRPRTSRTSAPRRRSTPTTSRCRSRSPAPTCTWRASCCAPRAARRS